MGCQIENAYRSMRSFCEEQDKEVLSNICDRAVAKAKREGRYDLFIPVGNVDETTMYVGNMTWFEDYEILTGCYKDRDGNEFDNQEEAQEYYEDEFIKKHDTMWGQIEGEEGSYGIYELCDGEINEIIEVGFDTEEEADNRLDRLAEEYATDKVDDLEFEYDEIYWNTVFQYNGDVDEDIAKQLGLGVLEVINQNHEHYGEKFMFLQGCGMDMSPKLVSYQALAHRYVSREFVDKFRDRSYFEYVAGVENSKKVYKALGIEELVKGKE